MIYKLQRPLASSNGGQTVLAYTEGRKHLTELAMTPELRKLFGSSYKIYVDADVVKGKLVIKERVKDFKW